MNTKPLDPSKLHADDRLNNLIRRFIDEEDARNEALQAAEALTQARKAVYSELGVDGQSDQDTAVNLLLEFIPVASFHAYSETSGQELWRESTRLLRQYFGLTYSDEQIKAAIGTTRELIAVRT